MTAEDFEQVLSLDLEDSEYLYRVQRGIRIVYVSLKCTEVIPRDDRTDSYRILQNLRCIPAWRSKKWTTLTITKSTSGNIECHTDQFSPHALNQQVLLDCPYKSYSFLSLQRLHRISDRLSRVAASCDRPPCISKIARFEWELKFLEREIRTYTYLMCRAFSLAPKFLGYIFEEEPNRVIGFIIEEVVGRHPGIADLATCEAALRQLHKAGVTHGDLNKYNIIIANEGLVKFIDFEASMRLENAEATNVAREEIENMRLKLEDNSGVGRR